MTKFSSYVTRVLDRSTINSQQVYYILFHNNSIQQRKIKEAKRINQSLKEDNLTFLWIISPTISDHILSKFEAKSQENWQQGVYFLAQGLNNVSSG